MISFYKPTQKVTGTALSFYLNKNDKNAKDGFSFWGELLKQASWDSGKRQGDFRANKKVNGKNINIKFSQTEIASFIDAMERNIEFSGYHGSNQVVRFSFGPYIPKRKTEEEEWVEGKVQKGFSFRVTREDKEDSTDKASFIIGLSYGEGVLLKTYLRHILKESFILTDKKRDEYFKNNYNKQDSNTQQEHVQHIKVEENDDDLW